VAELVAAAVAELVVFGSSTHSRLWSGSRAGLEPIAVVWWDVVLGVAAPVSPKSVQTYGILLTTCPLEFGGRLKSTTRTVRRPFQDLKSNTATSSDVRIRIDVSGSSTFRIKAIKVSPYRICHVSKMCWNWCPDAIFLSKFIGETPKSKTETVL